MPIFSTDTGEVISALVIGFKPLELEDKHTGMKSGIWTHGQLHLPALPTASQTTLNEKVADALANSDQDENYFRVDAGGAPQLLFYKRLNPGCCFRPLTKFAFIHSVTLWKSCASSGGKSAAPGPCFC